MQRFSGGGDGSFGVRFANKSSKIVPYVITAHMGFVLPVPLVDPFDIRGRGLESPGVPPILHLGGRT